VVSRKRRYSRGSLAARRKFRSSPYTFQKKKKEVVPAGRQKGKGGKGRGSPSGATDGHGGREGLYRPGRVLPFYRGW